MSRNIIILSDGTRALPIARYHHPDYSIASNITKNLSCVSTSDLEEHVIKATYDDDSFPKEKHVQFLIQLTFQSESRYLPPQNTLPAVFARLRTQSYRTVFKTMLVIHRMTRDGDIITMREFSKQSSIFNRLSEQFVDPHVFIKNTRYNMYTNLLKQYAGYLYQKFLVFQATGLSCEQHAPPQTLSWLTTQRLTTKAMITLLPALQQQIDKLFIPNPFAIPWPEPNVLYMFKILITDAVRLLSFSSALVNILRSRLIEITTPWHEALQTFERQERTITFSSTILTQRELTAIGTSVREQLAIIAQCWLNHRSLLERWPKLVQGYNRLRPPRLVTASAPSPVPSDTLLIFEQVMQEIELATHQATGSSWELAQYATISSVKPGQKRSSDLLSNVGLTVNTSLLTQTQKQSDVPTFSIDSFFERDFSDLNARQQANQQQQQQQQQLRPKQQQLQPQQLQQTPSTQDLFYTHESAIDNFEEHASAPPMQQLESGGSHQEPDFSDLFDFSAFDKQDWSSTTNAVQNYSPQQQQRQQQQQPQPYAPQQQQYQQQQQQNQLAPGFMNSYAAAQNPNPYSNQAYYDTPDKNPAPSYHSVTSSQSPPQYLSSSTSNNTPNNTNPNNNGFGRNSGSGFGSAWDPSASMSPSQPQNQQIQQQPTMQMLPPKTQQQQQQPTMQMLPQQQQQQQQQQQPQQFQPVVQNPYAANAYRY